MRTRTGWRAGEKLVLAWSRRRSRIGSTKAAVLPVPVWAAARTSRPSRTSGIAADWTGVGVSYPSSATMRTRSADRPSESKVKQSLLNVVPPRAPIRSATAARSPRVDGRGRLTGRSEHSRNGYDRTVTAAATRALEVMARAGVVHRVHPYALARAPRPRPRRPPELRRRGRDGPRHRARTGLQDARRGGRRRARPGRRPGRSRARPEAPGDAAGGHRAVMAEPGAGRNGRPATSSAGSARWARGAPSRSSSTCRRSITRRSSSRPVGVVSRSSSPRATWCVCASAMSARSRGTHASGLTRRRLRLAYSARSQASTEDRAQQKNAAPHGRHLSPASGPQTRPAPDRSPLDPPPRLRRVAARRPTSDPWSLTLPAVGGTTHRHRAPPRGVPAEQEA